MVAAEPVSILFVCTGNICRSPLAEALLKEYVGQRGLAPGFRISSAGIRALTGHHATYEAMEAGRRYGLDLREHRARQVDDVLMAQNDFVLCMTQSHRTWLRREFPQFKNKIYLTLLFPRRYNGERPDATDVPDPIGESVEFYTMVLETLEPALSEISRGASERKLLEDSHRGGPRRV
ncbi:MAG: arsenate reductase/protein-tyrosine-phosphatase family protein [Thermoleophilia bacterium]